MQHKSILIFGGGLNQYTLIKAANNSGITSVVLDPDPSSPGRQIASHFYSVKGDDYETTKKIALKHKVAGLATTQMEKPLRLMATLAQEIGLPFLSPEVVERSLDKWLMKCVFQKLGIPCANAKLFLYGKKIDQSSIKEFQYPLILKPRNAHSSQGVVKVDSIQQLIKNADITRTFSKNGEIIVEEFLEGPEYSVESITYLGNTTIIQYTEKFLTPAPYAVEMGHLQPAALSDKQKKDIERIVLSSIQALGIDNAATHAEIKLTAAGPKLLEIGPRGGGDFISSYLTLTSSGVNMDEAIIQVALGINPDLSQKAKQFAYIRYFDLPVGKKVVEIKNWQYVLEQPDVVYAQVAVKPGDRIEVITESKKRPGFVLVKGSERKDVETMAEKYIEIIKSKIILN